MGLLWYKYIEFVIALICIYVSYCSWSYAEGTNVFPPDEDDIATIFNPLREMCNDKVVCN